ncbi:helix-turn-helix transcriptional regulator [Lentzea sp. NPDC006480]|uniref:response regulator transcription factor n=1 Tax=Lentzea sp. NPDC006480 TaxID=3157176 RepID=UPI0033A08F1C
MNAGVNGWLISQQVLAPRCATDDLASMQLSGRELDVIRLMVREMTNDEIGVEMQLSTETVKSYVCPIGRKLRAHGRAGIVAGAIRAAQLD